MAKSPISVDPKTKFIEPYSFDNITDAFTSSNSTFIFKQNCRLVNIVFQPTVDSYKESLRVYRKFKGTDEVEFTELLAVIPTIHNSRIDFGKGFPIGICDEIYFECDSTTSKNIIIEITKWSLS